MTVAVNRNGSVGSIPQAKLTFRNGGGGKVGRRHEGNAAQVTAIEQFFSIERDEVTYQPGVYQIGEV
ncbi:hypothetical protein [Aliiruegeria lutimaris]|uniref:Uncharacterized protein n=1 Tax=Aliiruegeria lutimaris TaxID=571298 RepID=A0A1G9LP33_9RHOB|nr:hypothetical protein [Aliiruegeria lutimaris]SDL63501.1 hypothetical protein SAMN04488026_109918 [Aliiruegeria lutimaris]